MFLFLNLFGKCGVKVRKLIESSVACDLELTWLFRQEKDGKEGKEYLRLGPLGDEHETRC